MFGLVARNLEADRLLESPQLYRRIARNRLLSLSEFFLWFLQGLWHSFIIFFGWGFFSFLVDRIKHLCILWEAYLIPF